MNWKTETCKSCEYRRACEDATRIAELEEKIARLSAIVDKLHKTADGVPITPGMALYCRCGKKTVSLPDGDGTRGCPCGDILVPTECFSAPEAAEAARAEGGV